MIEFDDNETHLLTVRKHWFVLLKELIPLVFLGLLPAVLLTGILFVPAEYQRRISAVVSGRYSLVISGYGVWVLLLWTTAFVRITDYYLDAWYLTDKRVIDVEQRGFFSREVAAMTLDKIQDVKINVHGMMQTFFDFGDLHAQTAGEQREFIIRGVYSPYDCKEDISRVIRQYRSHQRDLPEEQRQSEHNE